MPNFGLLGIVMDHDEFYRIAQDGKGISVDVEGRTIKVGGKEFGFSLSELEIQLWQQGEMSKAFATLGKGLLEKMTCRHKPIKDQVSPDPIKGDKLDWYWKIST
jgi:3-isopropylmalate dehydratase small subunit